MEKRMAKWCPNEEKWRSRERTLARNSASRTVHTAQAGRTNLFFKLILKIQVNKTPMRQNKGLTALKALQNQRFFKT
jgi:hypothetical protein